MIGAEVDGLHVAAFAQIPEMQLVAYLLASKSSGTMPFSNCGGSAHSLDTM